MTRFHIRGVLAAAAAAICAALPATASADVVVEGPYVTGANYPNCQTGTWAPHATSNSGYYKPHMGDVRVGGIYYMAVWVIGNNNLCPSQYTNIEFAPPAETRLAISSQHPVRCWGKRPQRTYYEAETASCPQRPTASWYEQGNGMTWYAFNPTTQPSWPLPLDGAWQIEVPLQAVSPSSSTRALGRARTNYGPLTSWHSVKIDRELPTFNGEQTSHCGPSGPGYC